MGDGMNTVVEQLHAEESRLEARVKELRGETHSTESELKKVRAALAALGEKPARTKRRSSKPAPTQEDVARLIAEVTSQRGDVPEDELKRLVEAQLREGGNSLVGFGLRFSQALRTASRALDSES